MLSDENLSGLIKGVNKSLHERTINNMPSDLRYELEQLIANITPLKIISPGKIEELSGKRPVVAVDGSFNMAGSFQPYILYLFQAYAKSSAGDGEIVSDIFSPLLPEHYKRLEKLSREENLAGVQALERVKNHILTSMELQAAANAVKKYSPWLVLFDGGFMRFSRHASQEWNEYLRLAESKGVISAGIIEEAESYGLYRVLNESRSENNTIYDREMLFGRMETGECLMLPGEKQIKSEFYTVFARLSRYPQATAYDFLPGVNMETIFNVMCFLYTITPSGSRGIPLILDIVDSEVRITRREMELLLSAYLDTGIKEKFFISHRNRRDY
ncbi:MAG: DNA double-strand break repair nuclease NurA [Clostridiales bacterium]|nr:DNA double-strand break repair nuclease NurA [Clostridiales bacterium]MCF8021319.1 DNA double-strand break repair nuclease NurA [Clostridiales bacterium]